MIKSEFSLLWQNIQAVAEVDPKRLAHTFLDAQGVAVGALTYAQLDAQVQGLAACLNEQIAASEPVVLLYPAGLDFLPAFLACTRAGLVAVPLPVPQRPADIARLSGAVQDCGAAHVLTVSALGEALSTQLPPAQRVLHTDTLHPGNATEQRTRTAQKIAFLQYTSGSTAKPRGARIGHANLHANMNTLVGWGEVSAQDRLVSWLPHTHDLGLISQLTMLHCGGSIVSMAPETFIRRPSAWMQALSAYRGTISAAPNFAYDLCARKLQEQDLHGVDLSAWRAAVTGAEPVLPRTVEGFIAKVGAVGFDGSAFKNCYGLAETTLFVSGTALQEPMLAQSFCRASLRQQKAQPHPNGRKLYACGRPRDCDVRVLSKEGTECAESMVGEVVVRGGSVADGYQGQPGHPAFTCIVPGVQGNYLRTGDLGFLRQGELFLIGRCKDVVICRGANIEPQDVEETLTTAPGSEGLGSVAVFGMERQGTEAVVAVLETRGSPTPGSLTAVGDTLAAQVRGVHGVELTRLIFTAARAIPKTTSGKLQRAACQQAYLRGSLPVLHEWHAQEATVQGPADAPTEGAKQTPLAWLRHQVAGLAGLPAERVQPHDSLQKVGLSSVDAMTLAGRIETHFEVEFSPGMFWHHPTLDALANFLSIGTDVDDAQLVEGLSNLDEAAALALLERIKGDA